MSAKKIVDHKYSFNSGLIILSNEKLKPFFSHLGDLNLGAATNLLTRKVDKSKVWAEITLPLQLLVDCERIYYDMSYLQHKRWTNARPVQSLFKPVHAEPALRTRNPYGAPVQNACYSLEQLSAASYGGRGRKRN